MDSAKEYIQCARHVMEESLHPYDKNRKRELTRTKNEKAEVEVKVEMDELESFKSFFKKTWNDK